LGARAGSTGSVALAGTVLAVATLLIVVFLAQVPAANPNVQSSSLGSSSVSSSSNSTTVQPAAQAAASQYPLVWAPKPLGTCDYLAFCIEAELGFSGAATPAPLNNTSSATTIIHGNATTIVNSSATTIIQGISTTFEYPPENGSYSVAVTAFVQDAATGENVTTSSGLTVITNDCNIQPTGFTGCYIVGAVPSGHTYKVTVFVTKTYLPCSLRPAKLANLQCESQFLAPVSQTITITE
jgi:hypothetical protein